MRLACRAATVSAAIALSASAVAAQERQAVEKSPIVVRVQQAPSGQGYSYVYVNRDDGEPILLDSVLADRGYLGVGLLDLTPELRRHFGAPAGAGVMISKVEPDSPASRAGLETGDILIAIDGREIDSQRRAQQRISAGENGQTAELTIRRGGAERRLTATLETRRRKQLDLGGLLAVPHGDTERRRLEVRRELPPLVELDPESMSRALSAMREHFESHEWREQLERFRGEGPGLEARIRELEERLRELERQLEAVDD